MVQPYHSKIWELKTGRSKIKKPLIFSNLKFKHFFPWMLKSNLKTMGYIRCLFIITFVYNLCSIALGKQVIFFVNLEIFYHKVMNYDCFKYRAQSI